MTIIDTTKDVLNQLGISAFGIGIPVLSPNWVSSSGTIDIEGLDPTTPTTGLSADMSLTLKTGKWACPIAGTIRTIDPTATKKLPFPVTLVNPDGQIVQSKGLLLTLFPQIYVRLTRLYSRVLEQTPAANGQPVRPVPYYFFYDGETANINGKLSPSESFGDGTINSKLRIYDRDGLTIDPVAVASAFVAIMQRFPILQHRDNLSDPAIINLPLETMVIDPLRTQKNIQSVVCIRISDPEGKPDINSENRLNGITNISGISNTSGLFTLDGNLTGTITVKNVDANFSTEDRRLLMIGSINGHLDKTFHPPALPAPAPAPATAIKLYRDFFSIRIVQLKPFLLGNQISPDFKGKQLNEPQPTVCINEQLNLFTDGNDILASAIAALSNAPKEALCVAQTIDGNFPTPVQTGANAHWPQFPLPTGVPDNVALTVNLRNQFNPVAAYFNASNPNISNTDVLLTLNGLPPDATVRIYPRKFIEDARAIRGDGVGGIVAADGTIKLRLKDPLSLLQPGVLDNGKISVPTATTLFFDVMVLKRNGQARLYGNVVVPINNVNTTTPDVDPTPTPGNLFGSAQRRGICNAGILGLGKTALGKLPSLDTIFNLIQIATTFASTPPTGTSPPPPLPHEAPRLPTMSRRDLLVAGLAQNNNWSAVLAGGRLTPELHSAQPRLGSPGGLGGRETQAVGLSAANGRIAYDIARMALRRTDDIWNRLLLLADNNWNQPVEPSAPAANAATGAFAGAVLQTIAAYSETPKFGILKTASLINRPTKFKDLVNWIDKNNDIPAALKGAASQLQLVDPNFLQNLATKLSITPDPKNPSNFDPTNQLNNNPANPTLQRLYDELDRDLIASCYGRRDTQWALEAAISKARHFIYIETPGFTATQYPKPSVPGGYAVDLVKKLIDRLKQAPGLHVIICIPKFPDYGPGYEPFTAHEANERWDLIHNKMSSDRVLAFHPIGFPGRPSRLESSTIIIDDQWALIGSSAFRRRGLTFDGSSDLVFTHTDLVEGRAITINQFRQQLQNNRLGLQPPSNPGIPNPDFVRLQDGVEAFYLISEMLDVGGLGTIEPLWNGKDPSLKPLPPNTPAISPELVNPDGQIADVLSNGQIDPASVEFDINAALLLVGVLQGFP